MARRIYNVRPSFASTLVGLLVMVLLVYLLFRFAAFTVRTLVSGLPIFFGIGLILLAIAYSIDKEVPLRYFRKLGATARANPFKGFLQACATVLFSPFVFGWLLVKALFLDKMRSTVGEMQAHAQAHQRRQAGGPQPIGQDDADFTTVQRDDGLVIKIPKDDQ